MKDRFSLTRHGLPVRVMISSLVLSLGCLAGGCGGESTPTPGAVTAPTELSERQKELQANLKKQAAQKIGSKVKEQQPGPSGK